MPSMRTPLTAWPTPWPRWPPISRTPPNPDRWTGPLDLLAVRLTPGNPDCGIHRRTGSEPLDESRGEHDIDHRGNGVRPSPVALPFAGQGDPADGLRPGLDD